MFIKSVIRAIGLGSVVAFLTLGLAAGTALAGNDHNEPPPPTPTDDTYTGPPILRHIPGIRLLFGDYATTPDQYDAPNGQKKKKNRFDESYYTPQPAPSPARPKPLKPQAKPAATTPAGTASTSTSAASQKTASATPAKPLAGGPLSCDKATEVVSGYGFSSVEASVCSGKFYAFNAKRDGKTFAIKLDPVSGELTEVKKLP